MANDQEEQASVREYTLPGPDTVKTMSNEALLAAFHNVTGLTGSCLNCRENMVEEMHERGMYDLSKPSSLQLTADAVAERIGIPAPTIKVQLRDRDMTGIWTNVSGLESLVRAFLGV